jgi:hypothetical protein
MDCNDLFHQKRYANENYSDITEKGNKQEPRPNASTTKIFEDYCAIHTPGTVEHNIMY